MSLKHTWAQSIKNDAGASVAVDSPQVILGEAEVNFYVEAAATDTVEVDVTIDVSEIKSGFLFSDKAVTVKTNAVDAAGGQTIELAAGKAFAWNTGSTGSCPFTPDITKFYIHNAATEGAAAKVRGGFLIGTPE